MAVDLCNYKHGLRLSYDLLWLSSGFQTHMAQLAGVICFVAHALRH